MQIRINIATKPLENNRPFIAASGLVGAVAFLAFIILSGSAYRTWHLNRDTRTRIAVLERQIEEGQNEQKDLAAYFQGPEARQVLDRSAFLNSLITRRSFPWIRIFEALEKVLPPGVRVISIAPRPKDKRVELTLHVGALSEESEVKFLKELEASRVFSEVQVKNVRRSEEFGTTDRIRIELVVWYEAVNPT